MLIIANYGKKILFRCCKNKEVIKQTATIAKKRTPKNQRTQERTNIQQTKEKRKEKSYKLEFGLLENFNVAPIHSSSQCGVFLEDKGVVF